MSAHTLTHTHRGAKARPRMGGVGGRVDNQGRGLDFGLGGKRNKPPAGGGIAVEVGDTKMAVFGIVGLAASVAVAVLGFRLAPWLGWSAVVISAGLSVRLAVPAIGYGARQIMEGRAAQIAATGQAKAQIIGARRITDPGQYTPLVAIEREGDK